MSAPPPGHDDSGGPPPPLPDTIPSRGSFVSQDRDARNSPCADRRVDVVRRWRHMKISLFIEHPAFPVRGARTGTEVFRRAGPGGAGRQVGVHCVWLRAPLPGSTRTPRRPRSSSPPPPAAKNILLGHCIDQHAAQQQTTLPGGGANLHPGPRVDGRWSSAARSSTWPSSLLPSIRRSERAHGEAPGPRCACHGRRPPSPASGSTSRSAPQRHPQSGAESAPPLWLACRGPTPRRSPASSDGRPGFLVREPETWPTGSTLTHEVS